VTGDTGLDPEREPERRLPRPWTAAGAEIAHSTGEAVRRRMREGPGQNSGRWRVEGKFGASSRGNTDSTSVIGGCCS